MLLLEKYLLMLRKNWILLSPQISFISFEHTETPALFCIETMASPCLQFSLYTVKLSRQIT